MKNILIITSYFPPEIGAASNRIYHLAEGLQKHDYCVKVITPLPNYPQGEIFVEYQGKFSHTSMENNITIHRLWIYASNSKNKLLRLFSMLSFSFSLIWFFLWHKIPKTVIVQSPPLLVAFTSMIFLCSKKRKLILNVSDLWPIAGLKLGVFKKNFSYKILEKIEKYNYRKANLILAQSNEIITHVSSIFPRKSILLYRNYPDFEAPKFEFSEDSSRKIKLVYAGLLGVAQGVHKLCEELDYSIIEFHIYGSGSEQELIESFISMNKELPITYHGEVSRKELHGVLVKYDITIIPLLNRIYGSVPSKIFEYARLGLPIIYFGGGEGETIINKYNLGWVSEVENYPKLNNVLSNITITDLNTSAKERIQKTAIKEFDFERQLNHLTRLI